MTNCKLPSNNYQDKIIEINQGPKKSAPPMAATGLLGPDLVNFICRREHSMNLIHDLSAI